MTDKESVYSFPVHKQLVLEEKETMRIPTRDVVIIENQFRTRYPKEEVKIAVTKKLGGTADIAKLSTLTSLREDLERTRADFRREMEEMRKSFKCSF